jgi:type IV secretory pathway VirB10-like protein
MMKKIALLLAVVMLLSIPTVGFADEGVTEEATEVTVENEAATENETAEETDLPEAGITPDSWLYGLDKFMKELRLLITFDAAEKAGLLDEISGERLAEAREMVEANKMKYGVIAMKAYKAALEKTVAALEDAILSEKDLGSVLEQLTRNQVEKEKLAAIILEEIPEELRDEIEKELQDTEDDLEVTIDVTDYDDSDEEDTDEIDADTDTEDADETSTDDESTEENETTEEHSENTDEEADENEEEQVDEDEAKEDEEEQAGEEEAKEEDDENQAPVLPLKKLITVEILKEAIGEDAAQMYAKGELNLCQIMTIYSLAEQTEKTFDEVLDVFLENGKGIGVTAKALELHPKQALKGIKEVFKHAKKQIKKEFAEAKKDLRAWDVSKKPDKAENTEQERTETEIQAPVGDEAKDDNSKTVDKTAVQQKKEVKKLNINNSKKEKTAGSWKSHPKKDKSPSEDDDDANQGGNRKSHKNQKDKKEKQKANQSHNRSDRAKERSNKKQK